MQRLTIGAIIDGVETLTETLSLDPVTAIWVMDPFRKGQRVYFRTTTTHMIELAHETPPALTPSSVTSLSGGSYPCIHLKSPEDMHPLFDLFSVLHLLTGYTGGDDNFSAAFTYLALDQNPETGAFSGNFKVKNTRTGLTYPLTTGDDLTTDAVRRGLDALIEQIPCLTPDMADACLDAINDRLSGNRLRVERVEIGPNGVRVLDSRGDWWDDLTLYATPEELAVEFMELLDESGIQTMQARHEYRQYESELSAEEKGGW